MSISVAVATNGSRIPAVHQPAWLDVVDTGILLFNSEPRLMYMDGRATSFCARINFSHTGNYAYGVFPPEVTTLSIDLATVIQSKIESNDPTPIEIRRLAGNENQAVLLRGFGLPNELDSREGRILILMEDISLRKEICSKTVCERFRFTDRERAVVQQLFNGSTNKEIASALGTSEQKVKEVFKRIMYKTKTTTRTGILMEILKL